MKKKELRQRRKGKRTFLIVLEEGHISNYDSVASNPIVGLATGSSLAGLES